VRHSTQPPNSIRLWQLLEMLIGCDLTNKATSGLALLPEDKGALEVRRTQLVCPPAEASRPRQAVGRYQCPIHCCHAIAFLSSGIGMQFRL